MSLSRRQNHVAARRGKLVTFFRNGDTYFKGLTTSVSKKVFPSYETLLVWLNDKITTTSGVRFVFALPDAREITDIDQLENGRSYVVSSVRTLQRVAYGEARERFWSNKAPSAGRIRRGERELFTKARRSKSYPGSRAGSNHSEGAAAGAAPSAQGPVNGFRTSQSVGGNRPMVLAIISNTDRQSRQKVILNPNTSQSFEEMLKDVTHMIKMEFPPVTALHTLRAPHHRIQSYSQLLRAMKNHDEFLACGREVFPLEMQNKDTMPDTPMVSNAALSPRQPAIRKLNQVNRRRDDLPDDQPSRYSPIDDGGDKLSSRQPPGKPYKKTQPEVESVKVHIHGNLREFYVPRYGQVEPDGSKPERWLKLDWVYGYRGRDARNNLHTLPSGELVYHVAAVAVVYDRRRHQQQHYLGHTEDITCLAVHPDRSRPLVATGQKSGKSVENSAHIRVWSAQNLTTLAVIGTDMFEGGVSAVSFSGFTGELEEGSLLLALDEADKHTLSVWDWHADKIIAKTSTVVNNYMTSADTVVWGEFHPQDNTSIVTHGKQHIFFWKLFWNNRTDSAGRILRDRKSGVFPAQETPKFVTSMTFGLNGDVITGDSTGMISVWSRDDNDAFVYNNRCSNYMKHAHGRSVLALCMLEDGTLLSGGGHDIKAWDSMSEYRLVKERTLSDGCGLIRTLIPQNFGGADGSLYVGTTANVILEGSLQDKFSHIIQGHSEELWAVAAHPRLPVCVTAGYDQYVCKWDLINHTMVWRTHVEKPGMSVTFDPDGELVVVTTTVGRFIALSAVDGMHVASIQVGTEPLGVVSFSPDGSLLAVGSHDSHVYVYEVMDEGQVYRKHSGGVLMGHKNYVIHLDWSKDGRYLQSVSGDYDLMSWDVDHMKSVPATGMREVQWHTHTCILGYNVLGAWSNLDEGDDIVTVSRSNHGDQLAVGDNQGALQLYRYPCTAEKPEFHVQKKFSGPVTKVTFSHGDHFLLSTGGTDATLLQWSTTDNYGYA